MLLMVKKLLLKVFAFWALLLTPVLGWGQDCSPPTVTITNNTGSSVCHDETISFSGTVNTPNGTTVTSYQWQVSLNSGGYTNISGATATNIANYDPAPGSNKFQLIVNFTCDSDGSSHSVASSPSSTVTVYEERLASITIAANNTSICPGENVSFSTSNPANLGANPQYDWQLIRNSNTSSISTNGSFSTNTLQNGDQIRLFVTSSVPCVDPVYSTNTITITEEAATPSTPTAFTSGETAVCPGTSQTYTVPNDNTASEYIWSLPSGWAGSSTTNSITVTSGNSGSGNISVRAKNSCGTSEARSIAVSVKAGTPATPGAISGIPEVCPGVPQTFTIAAVTGADSYNWSFPSGWTGSSTSNSITLTPTAGSAQNGNLSVTAGNDCGTSAARILAISVKPGTPSQPGAFTSGPATLCPGTQGTYAVPAVTGATEYIWTLPPGFSSSNLTTSTPSLAVTAGNSGSGNITVKATNDCGTGSTQSFAIAISDPIPVMTGNIQGSPAVCANTPGVEYFIPEINNATSYVWSTSGTGWDITSQNSNTVILTSGSTAGTISVKAVNSCGESSVKSLTINLNPPAPAMPGTITFSDGTDKACINTAETYSFSAVSNASSYLWTLPNGTTQSTTSPSLSYTATSAGVQTLKVAAVNSCGTSNEKSFTINVAGGKPAQPGTIVASKYTVCPPETGFILTVPQSSDADSYQWFLPTGWEITAGAGTNEITVRINASSNYQNPTVVGVEAKNHCGNSTRRNTSSSINDPNAIAVSDFVFVDLGEDRLLCNSRNQVSITAKLNFGGKKLKINNIYSSSGVTIGTPNGKVDSHTFNYTPSSTDLANGNVTITLITENPGGACSAGRDELVLNFRPVPTATIASPSPICAGSSTDLSVTGTPNTILTYRIGTGPDQTVSINSSGTGIIPSGILNSTSVFNLRNIRFNSEPSCPTSLSGSTTVTVTPPPTATLDYSGSPFCTSTNTSQAVTLTTTGTTTGATFSAPSGLSINPSNGSINPSTSTSGTYIVTYSIPAFGGCEAVTATTEVEILEEVSITAQPTGDRICQGESVEFLVTATGDNLSYQWFKGNGGSGSPVTGATSNSLSLNNVTTANTGNYYVEVYGASPCNKKVSDVAVLTVDEDISITTQPANTIVCLGATANISIEASAGSAALNYQWYKGTPGSGSLINGATNANLEIENTTLADGGNYYVVVDGPNDFICEPVTSQAATLTIRDTPTAEISGSAEICDGGETNLYITNGTPNSVVNYVVNSGAPQTIVLDGAGEAVLPTGALNVLNDAVTSYNFTLTGVEYPDAPQCSMDITGTATITVNPTPDVDVSFENDQVEFCNDSYQGTFTPNLTGSGAYSGGVFSAEGLTVDSNTGAFTPANATAGEYTLKYFLDAAGGCSELAATLEIIIYTTVEITSEPFPVAVCTANSTQLEMASSGDNLAYQWFKVATPDVEVGTNSPVLELNNATTSTAGDYYVVVSGNGACASVESQRVTVTVDENIIVTQQPASQEVCLGEDVTLAIDATASGNNENIVYTWMYRPANSNNDNDWAYVDGGQIQNLNLENIGLEQAGQYRAEINGPDGFACDLGYSEAVVITVNEPPTVDAGTNIDACSTDGTVAIGEDASATNYVSLEWTTSGSGTFDDATSLTTNYNPGAGETGLVTLTLTVIGEDGCSQDYDVVNVTISNLPVINTFSYSQTEFCVSIATGQSPNLDISNASVNDGAFSYSGDSGNTLSLDPATGDIDPSNSSPGNYTITFEIPSDGICGAVSENFDITIGDLPEPDFAYTENLICKDTRSNNPNLTLDTDGLEHLDADFFSSTTGLIFVDASTGEININASTAGEYTITRTVDYSGTAEDGCQPVTDTYQIEIFNKPIPDFSYDSNGEFCSDEVDPTPVLISDAVIGTFSFTPAETGNTLSIDSTTGVIDLDASDPGTYTVRNTVDDATDACEEVFFEFDITIFEKLDPTFNYTASAYCFSAGIAQVDNTTLSSGGTFESSSLGSLLNANTGQITWSSLNEDIIGPHTITYTIPANGVCPEVSANYDIIIDALPVGGDALFEGAGRIFMTCEGAVSGYAAPLNLEDHEGQVVEWQYHDANNLQWQVYDSQNPGLTGPEVEALVSDKSTVFRAKIINGACTDPVYSKTAIVSVIPSNIEPSPVKVEPVVVCLGSTVSLSSKTGYGDTIGRFEGGHFTNAGIKNNGWRFTNLEGGSNDYSAAANNGRADHWLKMNASGGENGKVFTGDLPTAEDGTTIRWTSIAGVNEKFALVTGDNGSWMETPVFSLGALDEAILTWDQGYNLTTGATISVELSTNGGNSYNIVLFTITSDGSTEIGSSGNYTDFGRNKMVIDLGDYLGYTDLRVRFNYNGVRDGDVWAVDNVKVPEGPRGVLLQWFYDDDPNDDEILQIGQDNQETVTFPPTGQSWTKIGWNDFTVKTALLLDSNGNACESLNNKRDVKVFVFDEYTTTVAIEINGCGNLTANLSASISGAFQGTDLDPAEQTIDGYNGQWKIQGPDGATYTIKNQDENSTMDPLKNPEAIFEADDLADFEISWELQLDENLKYPDNFFVEELRGQQITNPSCPPTAIPAPVVFENCTTLDFDGVDDVVVINNTFTGIQAFEAWILPETSGGTIVSGPSLEVTTPAGISYNQRWYHLAVIYSGEDAGLYIDGIRVGNAPNGNGGGDRTSIGAKWTSANDEAINHFSGWIEEVRIWNNAPTLKELRFMMNQRLKLEAGTVVTPLEGEVVPNRTTAGSYHTNNGHNLDGEDDAFYDQTAADLAGYYRLISEVPDPANLITFDLALKPAGGNTPDHSTNNIPGRLYNITTHQENTSPTPYFSGADGDWATDATWARPNVWDPPHTGPIEWNIARLNHNIQSSGKEIIMLGVLSETPDKILSIDSDKPIRITHYLLLDGNMDLINESQLLQDHGSILAEQSGGWLQRDQQGKKLSFNYNYWSSPVSAQGSTPNNTSYSIFEVLRDSRHKDNPTAIKYSDQYAAADGALTNPMTLSTYWMWKFKGSASLYADWQWIGATGSIGTGEGYTMKGTDGTVDIWDNTQNYTFKGKPHNGNIILDFSGSLNHNYLIGNPYPSALDANKFIEENLQGTMNIENSSIATANFNGTIYFWSHFAGKSHYLQQYVGGYAAYNLSGGVEPASSVDQRINNTGESGGQRPEQFIAIGQGFFVNKVISSSLGSDGELDVVQQTGGQNIILKNTQRAFETETGESVFHSQEKKIINATASTNTSNAQRKIWLRFQSPMKYHRQLLVTADPKASSGFDLGYDAPLIEDIEEDMYWSPENYKFVIQGVNNFDLDQELHLEYKVKQKGEIRISIDELKNIPDEMNIFIRDSLLQVTHDMRAADYVVESETGIFSDRFKLVFQDRWAIQEPEEPVFEEGSLEVLYINTDREILIKNPELLEISRVYLNNMLGQQVHVYYNVPTERKIPLPVQKFNSGVYLVKVHSEKGIIVKKVIIE